MKKNRDEPTIDDEMSYNFATQTAAVFRTYGSSSRKHFRNGSHKYSVILSTRMHPMVRTAKARINGFESSQSYYNNKRKDKNGKNLDFAFAGFFGRSNIKMCEETKHLFLVASKIGYTTWNIAQF